MRCVLSAQLVVLWVCAIITIDDAGSTRGFQGDSIDTIGEAGSRQGFLGDGPVPSQPSRALSHHIDRINLHFEKLAASRLSTDTFGEAGSRQGFLGDGPVPSQPSRARSHRKRNKLHFEKLAANRLSTDTFGEAGSRQGFLGRWSCTVSAVTRTLSSQTKQIALREVGSESALH